MLSVTVAEWLNEPDVPVMVTKNDPVDVPEDMLNSEDPEPLMDAGLKLAKASPGSPETSRDTFPVNPLKALTATLIPALSPALMVCDEGEADRVKSPAGAVTVTTTDELAVRFPLVPTIVRV